MLEETGSYAALRDMVYRHYGSSVESKRDEILRNYEAAGVSLDTAKNESGYDEVDTEVMAAFVEEKLLTDYDTILSTVKTDRTLGERILDWLNKVLTKITGTKEQRFLIEARKKWSRALKEAQGENKKTPERTGERERYSISDNLENDLTKVKDGSFRGEHGEVYIGETSKFLEEVIGAEPVSVTMPAAKAYSAMATKEEAKKDGRYNETMNYHGLGVNGLMEILERAENPLIAFAATSEKGQADRSNRIVLVTDKRIGRGLAVVINEVSTTALIQGKRVAVNKTITVYGREQIRTDVAAAMLDKRLLYVDKKRSQNLAGVLGSNYQAAIQGIDFNKNIQQFWDNVNRKSKKSSAKVKKSNARYSIGTAEDTAYLEAVERGDMETAQRMVDEAAKKAGYTRFAYHETMPENDIHVFNLDLATNASGDHQTPYGIFTKSHNRTVGLGGKQMRLYLKAQNTFEAKDRADIEKKMPQEYWQLKEKLKRLNDEHAKRSDELDDEFIERVDEFFDNSPNGDIYREQWDVTEPIREQFDVPSSVSSIEIELEQYMDMWRDAEYSAIADMKKWITGWLKENGYDSMYLEYDNGAGNRVTDAFIVLKENQVKSADPVVYDDNGGVIPLSKRFNEDNDDIRYSIGYTEDNEPFVEVDRDILEGVPRKDWVKTVKNNLRDRFPDGVQVGNELVEINKQSKREMTYSEYTKYLRKYYPSLYADKLRATDNADEIIKASRNYVGEGLKHLRNDKIIEFSRGTVLLQIGDKGYSAEVVVGTQEDDSLLLYDIINLKPTQINKKSQAQGKARDERKVQSGSKPVSDTDSISNSSSNVKKKFSIDTKDLKVDKETRDLITAHNAAMREVFYSRSRSDQTELWDMIKDEMAHILRTGAAQRKAVNEIVQLAYDTGYRIARRENEAVNTWGKGIYVPEKYMGEMASLGGLKAMNNKLMGSGLYFTYRQKKQDSNVNYGSLDEAYSVLSESNPILAETTDPAEQVREIVDLFGSRDRRQSLRELDEEAYEMGEDSEPYLTDIRNAVEEAMDDIATMARYKMIQAARKSGKAEGRKKGTKEQKKAQQKADEATMREYDKLRKKLAEDERKDAEATMRMHDKLIREVREEDRKLSEKEKREIRQGIRKKEKEWDKEMKRQASDFKREQKKSERNAETNLESVLRQAEKERKQLERQLNEPQKKEMQRKRREVDTARRKERIETAKAEYRRNNPPPATGTTKDLYQKNTAARGIVERFRQEAITGLVKSGAFTETNGDVLLLFLYAMKIKFLLKELQK